MLSLVFLLAGALFTSVVSGVVGMVGGVLMLAVMTLALPAAQVVPLHGVVQLASNSTRILVFLPHVAWRVFAWYALPMAAGAALAASLWTGELGWFRPGIGAFILVFLFWRRHLPKLKNLPYWTYVPAGFAAGFVAIYAGAIGPFVAPFLLRDDMDKEQVIATQAVCQAWAHFLKIPAFLALGFDYRPHAALLAALIACVIAGTVAGKRLLGMIPREAFMRLLEVLLALVALHLLITSLT